MKRKPKSLTLYSFAIESYRNKGKMYERIQRRIESHDTDTCWLWPGACANQGYEPVVGVASSVALSVRKIIFLANTEFSFRSIRRLCVTRNCVNPWHTDIDGRKIYDRKKASAILLPERLLPSTQAKMCHKGHPIIGQNIYLSTTNIHLANGTIKKHPRSICRLCHYYRMEKRTHGIYRKSIQRIERDLETFIGRSLPFYLTYKGKV